MREHWSRRTLLAWAALTAGGCAASTPAAGAPPAKAQPTPRAESVIVVGAGLAGLACAYRLLTRGQRVLVLEASERAGGRICTLRQPWRDGLFVEAGAGHLVPDPSLLGLLGELELRVEPRPSGAAPRAELAARARPGTPCERWLAAEHDVVPLGPAGHHAPEDAPDAIGSAITDWLERRWPQTSAAQGQG